jgi:hypothetical protein
MRGVHIPSFKKIIKHFKASRNIRYIRRKKAAEMKFMRRTSGYSSLCHRRNEGISEELNVDPVEMTA